MSIVNILQPSPILDSFGSSSPKESAQRLALAGQLEGDWHTFDNQPFYDSEHTHFFRIITMWRYQHHPDTAQGLVIIKSVPVSYGDDGFTLVPRVTGERG